PDGLLILHLHAGMAKIEMQPSPSGDRRPTSWERLLDHLPKSDTIGLLQGANGFVIAGFRLVQVQHGDSCRGTRDEPDASLGPFRPPPADLILIRSCVL